MSTRKVNVTGKIKHEGDSVFVSQALAGWDVGLSAREDGDMDLYFSRLLLGRLERETGAFVPATTSKGIPSGSSPITVN
jgi:hypothetical protein